MAFSECPNFNQKPYWSNQGCRNCGRSSPFLFWPNSVLTRGADFAHHSTTTPSPGFSKKWKSLLKWWSHQKVAIYFKKKFQWSFHQKCFNIQEKIRSNFLILVYLLLKILPFVPETSYCITTVLHTHFPNEIDKNRQLCSIAGVSPICPRSLEAYLNGSSWIALGHCTAQEQATAAVPARRQR